VLTCVSQYSDDPRVFVDGHTPLSAGWEFANEAWRALKLSEPTIHEVQMYFVCAPSPAIIHPHVDPDVDLVCEGYVYSSDLVVVSGKPVHDAWTIDKLLYNRGLVFAVFNNGPSFDGSLPAASLVLKMNYGSEYSGTVICWCPISHCLTILLRSFVIFDRMNCVFLGRPISLQPEEYGFLFSYRVPFQLLLATMWTSHWRSMKSIGTGN
jgi:hypothetical protein